MDRDAVAAQILKRYMDEGLPEFSEMELTDVNQIGNFGNSPLNVACIRGICDEVVALLNGGVNVNAVGELGNTPLHEAIAQGHVEIVKILLNSGAARLARNEFEETPLEMARARGLTEIVDLMRE
ncbi:ankyrin repeat domain-containing protein (plasmid) [Caballeronia sp. NK8]|uniref:ankyrin repeat domain-containing protein n=1 Tax=Caballeronia sp. NK8 TaxID=140098 RepID=UPI001BB4F009|nr:ankyrin repeat domain-containing protein [Caballeronia sp. NK8]BCQ27793.1 ankyrin repeat domain-containing protein [Caballeronia sp. NK8]